MGRRFTPQELDRVAVEAGVSRSSVARWHRDPAAVHANTLRHIVDACSRLGLSLAADERGDACSSQPPAAA